MQEDGEQASSSSSSSNTSISRMTTEEWRAKYEKDGTVDLWVEEEFNSGSRLVVGDVGVAVAVCSLQPSRASRGVRRCW